MLTDPRLKTATCKKNYKFTTPHYTYGNLQMTISMFILINQKGGTLFRQSKDKTTNSNHTLMQTKVVRQDTIAHTFHVSHRKILDIFHEELVPHQAIC